VLFAELPYLNTFYITAMSKAANSEATDELVSLFKSIGLSQVKAQEAAKSPKNAASLKNVIEKFPAVFQNGLDEKQAGLIVVLAGALVKSPGVGHEETDLTISKIVCGKLKTVDQVTGDIQNDYCVVSKFTSDMTAAVKYTETHRKPIDEVDFDKYCGIGTRQLLNTKSCLTFASRFYHHPYGTSCSDQQIHHDECGNRMG
jgi:glutaminyl-tRNA synthetase